MAIYCIHFSASDIISFFFVVDYSTVYLFCSFLGEKCSFYSWLPLCALIMHQSRFTYSPLLCLSPPPLILCPVVTATINRDIVGFYYVAGTMLHSESHSGLMIFNSRYPCDIYTLRKLTCGEFKVFLHFIPVEDAIRTPVCCEKTPSSESVCCLGSLTFSAFPKHPSPHYMLLPTERSHFPLISFWVSLSPR